MLWYANLLGDNTMEHKYYICFVISFGNAAVDEMSILAPLKQCKQYVCWINFVENFLHSILYWQ